MNPRVGLTVVTSSFMMRLTIVVLPALSRPLQCRQFVYLGVIELQDMYSISILISLSFSRAFRNIDSISYGLFEWNSPFDEVCRG